MEKVTLFLFQSCFLLIPSNDKWVVFLNDCKHGRIFFLPGTVQCMLYLYVAMNDQILRNRKVYITVRTCFFFQIDICGFMYYWDLSIDMIISTILVVALGFAVDYSGHIGHAFMAAREGNRNGITISAYLLQFQHL